MQLASDFAGVNEADWRKLVEGVLKGADFNKKLVGKTADGLAIQPLYTRRADAGIIAGARRDKPWGIVVRLDHPNAEIANIMALEELEGGADTLTLTFAGSPMARGFGLPDPTFPTLDTALKGIHCDLIALRLETAPFAGRAAAMGMAELIKNRRLVAADLNIDFGLQPLADQAITGSTPMPSAQMADNLVEIIRDLQAKGFAGPFIRCDSRPFHEAGASEVQELASILAQGVAYLRMLQARGIAVQDAARMLSFTITADVDQLLSIAKMRALRLLWGRIEETCGLAVDPIRIHAETAWRMLSRRDPHVNILRATIATFSAGVGGADSIGVLPFTNALGLPDASARRLARNTSLILTNESNLHRVIDPAAGSGGIEALTDALCLSAWALFQEIEAQRSNDNAGFSAALENGFLWPKIEAVRHTRDHDLATRRLPLTGTSEFPNLAEAEIAVLLPRPAEAISAAPNASRRLAEPYEYLRDRAESLAKTGEPVKVFLANLGRVADFTVRSMFAKNAFEAGGIAAITNDGFAEAGGTDLVALTDAYRASGAPFACICSSDALYAEEAQDAAMALMASGAQGIFLAGKPGEHELSWRAAGISGFLGAGMDVPAFLAPLLSR